MIFVKEQNKMLVKSLLLFFILFDIGECQRFNPFGLFEEIYRIYGGFLSDIGGGVVKDETDIRGSYDFVIVGVGSAGSVVANRLTEESSWDVLALEAGKDEMFLTDIPLLAPALYQTDYNWGYMTEPGPVDANGEGGYCLAMIGGRCRWPQGKAVGGTSVINYMLYVRGGKVNYDSWEAQGNPGWSYKDVLPYFMKSEKTQIQGLDPKYHGKDGYLDSTHSPYASKLGKAFLDSAKEMGYRVNDYNAENLLGFSIVQANLRGGRRWSGSKAFLSSASDRKNLHVSKHSRVTRIVIDPATKRAVGVEFVKNRRRYRVKAVKEVIVCAGALNSPQILMLSGIGPEDHLKSLGIRVVEDLPVGYNLQDHVSMNGLVFLVNDSTTLDELRTAYNPVNALDYFLAGKGPYTVPGGAEGIAFLNTRGSGSGTRARGKSLVGASYENLFGGSLVDLRNGTTTEDDADIEIVMGLSSFTGDHSGLLRGILNVREDFARETYGNYMGRNAISLVPILMHPKSRGRVTLKSSDPFRWPVLHANYFTDPEDLATMVRGIRKAVELASTDAFQRHNATLLPVAFPGCRHLEFASDSYWACAARFMGSTLGHFVGTCKMAPRENGGVVDARLRVHGVQNLRVVDASIMPTIIAGHTNAPAYMIGEKASDMIKSDWRY